MDRIPITCRRIYCCRRHERRTPKECLAKNPSMAAAAEALSATSLKLIGGVEVAGALGLILPWLTGIQPILTPVAASVLVPRLGGAAAVHGRRAEYTEY